LDTIEYEYISRKRKIRKQLNKGRGGAKIPPIKYNDKYKLEQERVQRLDKLRNMAS
jgi:hypothetical protein